MFSVSSERRINHKRFRFVGLFMLSYLSSCALKRIIQDLFRFAQKHEKKTYWKMSKKIKEGQIHHRPGYYFISTQTLTNTRYVSIIHTGCDTITCSFKFGAKCQSGARKVGLVSLEKGHPKVSFILGLVTAMRWLKEKRAFAVKAHFSNGRTKILTRSQCRGFS